MGKILSILKNNVDKEYKVYLERLIPNIPACKILGVRKPIIKSIARDIGNGNFGINQKEVNEFLNNLPHIYHEENILHVYILMQEHDKCIMITRLDKYLPYIDNWETCDLLTLKPLLQDKILLHEKCTNWINSDAPYIKRFGIVTEKKALKYGIDQELFHKIVNIKSSDYYVNMAIAWYLQESLLYEEELVIDVLKSNLLSKDIFQFTIEKINESFKVNNDVKLLVNSLKTKIK